jgi:hypothetical protein
MRETLRAIVRRLGAVLAECSYAQRRVTELKMGLNGYVTDPDQAPDTYQEFIVRTPGLLRHEPTAARRSARRTVR